jgi:ribosome-binding factor A
MAQSKVGKIKHAQRTSFFLREVSELFLRLSMDNVKLQELYVTRVELSPDRGMCIIFFHTPLGEEEFQRLMPTLILYKPSLRSALAKANQARYTPDLKFAYDEGIDHQNKIEDLFNKLKDEGKL